MAIGDTFRILTDEDFRIMTPRRRPKGEPAKVTIRNLQRERHNLTLLIADLRGAQRIKDTKIAEQDARIVEAETDRMRINDMLTQQAVVISQMQADARKNNIRLAYLEGYYDRTQETLPDHIARRERARDTQAPAIRETPPQEAGQAANQTGADRRSGGEIRRGPPDNPAHSERRPPQRRSITDEWSPF